jgi:hypothetical protein
VIEIDGSYLIPTLPAALSAKLRAMPEEIRTDRERWPGDFREEYFRHSSAFTKAVNTYRRWVRKDRDSKMTSTVKEMIYFLLDSLNFETARCDPGHLAIADELGVSERTVERLSKAVEPWVEIARRGKTKTNAYRFRVSVERVDAILQYSESLKDQREAERKRKSRYAPWFSDPTSMTDHFEGDPTSVRGSDPTSMTDRDPTSMTGKLKKGTYEEEHTNLSSGSGDGEDTSRGDAQVADLSDGVELECSRPLPIPRDDDEAHRVVDAICEGYDVRFEFQVIMLDLLMRGLLSPHLASHLLANQKPSSIGPSTSDFPAREAIPTDEGEFGPWVSANIPDQTRHRDALRLLRENKMTPEILEGMAA